VERWDPPIATGQLAKLKAISDEWLTLPGRRERRFTLGEFEPAYVSATPIYVACDAAGEPVAFLNLAPTYRRDEAAVDLMRRRHTAPNGIIDYLFTKAFVDLKARGHARVHLGMAPLNGFHAGEQSNWEERLVHAVLTRFDRIFSFEGLRSFKAKYATRWEPRYAVYRSALDLPRFGMALRRVTEHEAA
jgi:phosphatidylglycerol lysyltransferase